MRPTARLALVLALLVALAAAVGCDSGPDEESAADTRPPEQAQPDEGFRQRSDAGRTIRRWLSAVGSGDFGEAARFFAPGALIDQGVPFRLPDREAARTFNAGLPCRADLVELEDEGEKALASFRLRAGPGGPCSGIVKVRFSFSRDGRFSEWRQLGEEEPRPGQTV